MNEREVATLSALQSSRKYGGICPETVERMFTEELGKRRSLKDADKATRARLHQITGAFMSPDQLRTAARCLDAYAAGDETALHQALRLHTSTSERFGALGALYDRVFAATGLPDSVLDLACGLNPLYLGSIGIRVRGVDISGDLVELVNRWSARCGWDVVARTLDLSQDAPLEPADLALMMKLLPVLEQQRKGAGMALLARAPAPRQLVSFPTRTLSGRGVGMEQNYTRWFEDNLPGTHRVLDRFVLASELCYITEATNG